MSIIWHFSPVLYMSAFYMILEHTDECLNDVISHECLQPVE